MTFIITADTAEGTETIGEVKWDDAKTTPKEEFCMPTCKEMSQKENYWLLSNTISCHYRSNGSIAWS
jgi:hypothetical protein